MIQDLHSHTYYSFCGGDRPEDMVETVIKGGIELLGICDHSYGIGCSRLDVAKSKAEDIYNGYDRTLYRYFDHINLIKEKYADRINIMRGIEITIPNLYNMRTALPESEDVSFFDYCLLESPNLIPDNDIFTLAHRFGCPTGIAHTDMFSYIDSLEQDPYRFFKQMASEGIFWEMNVNYDSVHCYREHAYVKRFFSDSEQQAVVRESGVRLSVGFDGHKHTDYRPDRVAEACERITAMGIKLAFDD